MFPINNRIQQRLIAFLSPDAPANTDGGEKSEEESNVDKQISLSEKIDSLPPEKVEDLLSDSKKAEQFLKETDEERTARETKEAEDKKKQEEEEEAERLRLEEEEKKKKAEEHKGETEEQKKAREAKEADDKKKKTETDKAKLIAGKYKTMDEALTGLENAMKVLNYNPEMIKSYMDLIKKTNDVSIIEKLYPELDKAISANQKAIKDAQAQQTEAGKQTDKSDTLLPTTDATLGAEIFRLAVEGTLQDLANTASGKELADAGISLPADFLYDTEATKAFLSKLKTEDPVLYLHLERDVVNLFNRNQQQIANVQKAVLESEQLNPKTIEVDVAKIKNFADKIGLKVDEAELKKFIESLAVNPAIYEKKHGADYIRADAIYQAWQLANLDKVIEQTRLNAELNGRKQAAEDLKNANRRVPGGISHNNLPASQRDRNEKANDANTLLELAQNDALSPEKLDELLQKGLPAQK